MNKYNVNKKYKGRCNQKTVSVKTQEKKPIGEVPLVSYIGYVGKGKDTSILITSVQKEMDIEKEIKLVMISKTLY